MIPTASVLALERHGAIAGTASALMGSIQLVTGAAVLANGTDGDAQVAVFSRYAKVNFIPDVFGDLVFNDVASNVIEKACSTEPRLTPPYNVNDRHTLRVGLAASEERTT